MEGGIAAGLRLGDLGFKIRGVTVKQVLQEPEYFKEILKRNKVIGFKGMDPTPQEHLMLMEALYYGELGTDMPNGEPGMLEDQHHASIPNVEERDNVEHFIKTAWHVDNPFLEKPPVLTSMKMIKFDVDPGYGDTLFLSLTDLYRQLPDHLKDRLQTARLLGTTGNTEPGEEEGREVISHPALRTHPDTGETMLYWTGPSTMLETDQDPPPMWFQEVREFVTHYAANKQNRWSWQWEVGDVLVWDNRAVLHGFVPGWDRADRRFDRFQIGDEVPFYDPNQEDSRNPNFGDTIRYEGVEKDSTSGPNPDHIPLVFTKGFYALEEVEHLYQQVTLFVMADENGEWREDVNKLAAEVGSDLFNVYIVEQDPSNAVFRNLMRYKNAYLSEYPIAGTMYLCSRNGDFHCFWEPDFDLFQYDNEDCTRNAIPHIKGYINWHPDMRHAGHAWHYPDWFPHQPLQFRPWAYQNLSFMQYINWGQDDPPEDFLVQFAIDTIYGCFNHLKDNDDRRRVIERIHDYIDYMLELNEHEKER
jgi:taurine dioxygenase